MEQLLSIKAPINKINKQKTTVKKNIIQVDYSTRPKMFLTDKVKYVSIKAYLDNDKHAFFLNKVNPCQDYFYQCLEDLKRQHKEILIDIDDSLYKVPYNSQGFTFKVPKKYLTCFDKNGRSVTWNQCINKKVDFKLRVYPYDFISKETNQRIVGLSILVSSIHLA